MQQDGCSGEFALRRFDLKAGLAIAGPPPGLGLARFSRDYLDAVGHHERAVEPHAKLADQVRILFRVSGQLGEEVPGSGARNGAQVGDQFLVVHADAGIGDGERLFLFVQFQVDARRKRNTLVGVVHQSQVAQCIQRVGGVGNQFAEKYLGMRIERMNDQVQQLMDFGLEFTLGHDLLSRISI